MFSLSLIIQEADIQIAPMNKEQGEAPYSLQTGDCGEPAGPIHLSTEYLMGLHTRRDDMIVKYGPIGGLSK